MTTETDMPETAGIDPNGQYGRLWERVEGQGRDIVDLRSNMNTGFSNVQGSIKALSDQFSGSSRTQWPVIWSAIGVSFAVLGAVGALAYRPVLSNQDRLETALVRLAETTVSQKEMEWRSARGAEDRTRTDSAIADLRQATITRAEWLERNRARDQEVADLGRRVDELRSDVGAVYGTRDIIQDMKKEIDNLRSRFNTRSAGPP